MAKTAIVTGAASGLGRAICVRLARDGWHLALADIDVQGAAETLELVRAAGSDGRVEPLDVSSADDWIALKARLQEDWPQLDLLVNNAGIGASGEIGQFSLAQWERLLRVNLWGAIYGCHFMVDWLKQNTRGAHLINTASFAAMATAPAMSGYNVAKAGVLALSETLAGELRPYDVGVTVLCPLFFRTNLLTDWSAGSEAEREAAEYYTEHAGFTAADVADAAVRAMHRKQLYVILGRKARWYWRMKRLMPRTFMKLMAYKYQSWVEKWARNQVS